MKKQNLVIIGNGMVGQKLLDQLAESGATARYAITVLCEEPRPAYDRVQLTAYFSGKSAADLALVEAQFFADHDIRLELNCRSVAIDRSNRQVETADGTRFDYDKLVLATGSFPFVPPIPGHDRDGCYVYRTLEDLDAIRQGADGRSIGVVVGGGLLGLEAAKALKDLGLKTHVVEFAPRLMAVQVDEGGGKMLRGKIEALGVVVHTEKNTQEIVDGSEQRHKMRFVDGSELESDLIVFSAGIRPRDELARQAELDVGPRGGIVVNNWCQTSDPDIYAIGEVALWDGRIFGLVAPGYQMARVAAAHLQGSEEISFTGADMSTKLKLMGVDVASIGDAHARTPGARSYTYIDEAQEIYKRIVVSRDGKKLLGSVLVGNSDEYGTLLQMALNDISLPEHPDQLILPSYDGSAPKGLGVEALPESAQICSCNNVTKGEICAAVTIGSTTLASLKAATKAATSCGGCSALVTQVLNAELTKQGIEVKRDLCQHFPYSRQELYHLVRVGQIRSFKALIGKHGSGFGCDICKPVAASIFASCWNDHVLDSNHAVLQDTNDYYLANMQKDGSYSVVPRVAGGEITPDKLVALGQVAIKYDLYSKITGGQRIDLFGARVEQLPLIWKDLIDAGFESGHAYGKALRTVKSCVGSTWCRYGMQDSVSMAILIENRYKGLRAPHKLKMAVSGCTRECAEAQSKDVGVIATERGWNLYLCGNGGMKPRHADLFATDLDDAALIRAIDRFFMFYIRTADRLQRTSVWMDNLEGGLDYLRSVILADSLGIGTELEQQMQRVIDTYQCEWKSTIEDPVKLKRFRHFVNSDGSDSHIRFVRERGQKRPATAAERSAEQIPLVELVQ